MTKEQIHLIYLNHSSYAIAAFLPQLLLRAKDGICFKAGRVQIHGTVAQFQVRPGTEKQLDAYNRDVGMLAIPGLFETDVYRFDADPVIY